MKSYYALTAKRKIVKKSNGKYVMGGKEYKIRGLTSLIVSDRNFCIEHDEEIAQDLRDYWKAQEYEKSVYMGGGIK